MLMILLPDNRHILSINTYPCGAKKVEPAYTNIEAFPMLLMTVSFPGIRQMIAAPIITAIT